MSVFLSVCPSVSVFTFDVPFKRLPPLPEVGCPIFFRDSESLEKSNGSGFRFEHFCLKIVKNHRAKKSFFADFVLQNMVETTLSDGLETSG